MGVRREVAKRAFASPWKLGLSGENFWKTWNQQFNSDYWVNSFNDSSFADMTLTQHKSQVHYFGNMQLWACSSLTPLLWLQRQVAKLVSELLYYWPSLRNNNMVTNLRRLQVTVVCILPHVTTERRLLGR